MEKIDYKINPAMTNAELNVLFRQSWKERNGHDDFSAVLEQGLGYVCAFRGQELVGFVNIAWDGNLHGFILDTTVVPELRRRGVGLKLLKYAENLAREKGLEWLHVDFIPELRTLYEKAGYQPTEAGLLHLNSEPGESR